MSKIYEVRSTARDSGKLHSWGAKNSYDDAVLLLKERFGEEHKDWAERNHLRWWIEEIDTRRCFNIPPKPTPRDMFSTREHRVENGGERWNYLDVEILNAANETIAKYGRNYGALMQTFEPFRQGEKMFALISSDYTATSVMDLSTGEIIASETPDSGGFCPAGFYVPDWWDIHDGSLLPGSSRWKEDYEEPKGNFGFVWGCVWGDDSSWKIQYLDLSNIQDGKILRDERFGYVKLATNPEVHPKEFIRCSFYNGECTVNLKTENEYDLASGKLLDPFE